MPSKQRHQWEVGDLVLRENAPKTFRLLMEIVALQPAKARLRYFESGDNPSDGSVRNTDGNNSKSEIWVALEELVDPGWYLKTQQFEQALHEHMLARKTNKRGDGA